MPLYYLLLGLYLLFRNLPLDEALTPFQWLFQPSLPFSAYPFFLQNIWMAEQNTYGGNFLGVTWSLAVEEQFYLFLPLVVRLIPPLRMPAFCLACFLVSLCLRTALFLSGWPELSWSTLVFCRMDALFAGVLLAFFPDWRLAKHRQLAKILFFSAMILLGLPSGDAGRGIVHPVFEYSLLALFYSSLLVLVKTAPNGALTKILSSTWVIWLAPYSYCIYLFHQLFHGLVEYGAILCSLQLSSMSKTAFALLLTMSWARMTYRLFELRLIAIGHRFQWR